MEEEKWRRNKPPEDETVIVTVKDDTADRPYYYTSTGWYFKGLWVVDNAPGRQVIAWKPLPKPFVENS